MSGYILGRGYKYSTCGKDYLCEECDDRLGVIDVENIDKKFVKKINNAVKWVRDVKKNGKTWSLLPVPTKKELYPNMCNTYDAPFHEAKKELAEELKEITLLWCAGYQGRQEAHKKGITKWNDPKLTAKIMKRNGKVQSKVINAILDLHKSNDIIRPKIIKNNYEMWQKKTNC